MNPFTDEHIGAGASPTDSAEMIAIAAITHIAASERLLGRFLDLSGLTVADLRAGVDTPDVQRAALDFLAAHEPDLLACAQDTGIAPADMAAARAAL